MSITRRKVLGSGAGLGAVVVAGGAFVGAAHAGTGEELIAKFTGGASATSGKITLGAPEIAENGNTVPIEVSVESAMSAAEHVSEVLVVATGNPSPEVVTFKFTPASGTAKASTRIRLAKTQELVAVAKMSDGSFFTDSKTVKVTIGGCGG